MNQHAVATAALALSALLGSCGGTGKPPTSNPPINTQPQQSSGYCQGTTAALSTGTSGPPVNGTSGIEGTGLHRNAIVSNGRISGLGSIFVEGIEYSLDSATILVDGRTGTGSDLNVGQVVTVVGFAYVDTSGIEGTGFNRDTALTGTATTVTATTDIGGPIETISADGSFLTVLGQSVEIDQFTRATSGLQLGTFVSISGFRNSKGIWSTRYMHVERTVMPLHLSGIVTELAADKTFKIGNLVVNSSSAQLSGFPSGIAEGDNVRVTGTSLDSSGTLVAEAVAYIDPALPGNPGDFAEVEGWVTRFVSAQDFDVNEHHVATDSNTSYSPSSVALDRFARVSGTRDNNGGVLASSIEVCTLTAGPPRSRHKAVLLSNGKVLLTGGPYCGEELELFDPSTQTFEPAGFLASSDEGQSATLLADGKVLFEGYVAGEVYDPTTQQSVGTGSRVNAPHRGNVTTARLLDGRVLIAGGHPNSRRAWLYDPLTNRFNAVGDMISARADHTETLLPSGDVLIAGGWNGTYRDPNDGRPFDPQFVELFSPRTLTFQMSACMAATRTGHTATSLANGDVLLLGGSRGGNMPYPPASLPYAEVFSATSHTIHALSTPDLPGSPVLLPNGKVVLLGGATAAVLDPATGTVTVAPGLITARTDFSATLLPDGRVLVIGGIDENGTTLASIEYWSGLN